MCSILLEAEACANGVGALERRSGAVGVVDGQTNIGVFLLTEGHVDRGTGTDTAVGRSCVASQETRLQDITCTELQDVKQPVLETQCIVVAQEGVRGETRSNSEALVPLLEQEIVGETDVEAGGKLHLRGSSLNGEGVASMVDHRKRMTSAAKLHRGTPVLEGDTELQLIVLTSHILDTCINGKA